MAWIWITLTFALIAHLRLQALLRETQSMKKLPPGPTGFPILGKTLTTMQFLKTQNLAFVSRPPHEASKHMSYEQRSLAFAPYSLYWRNIRKIEEVSLLVNFPKDASHDRMATDLSVKISSLSANMSCRMVFGKKYIDKEFDERGVKAVIQEAIRLEGLDYLDMVIKETMRLHPVAPLLLPHEATEDCTVNGFHKSRFIVNEWSIGRDPKVWTTHDPKEFMPERFLGHRGHPGMQLDLTMVRFVIAQLMRCFDWELPSYMSPSELDMTEEFVLTIPKAKHLVVTSR
ncbi:hypothetical protein EUGRSUZ_I00334 [Eucalyptus grandis]|uniref:Uncharacterized protein n=2 Tax=Eucalyptus grandis TaxID=71139 RepID=A0ACC3JEM1_EUCGR|nr:hypothetical protein EUGRSUZ_I00334 [Eucalyptus grandis]